ncbi:hypothetical protein EZY14_002795 [Kordia sp. TARA_039_SRF]|nr:hypothetical protein EZY14_002795 [Kordia sp. TARA_039_SRF]
MDLSKNNDIQHHICYVAIKSIDDVVDLSVFTNIYSALSKISFTNNVSPTTSGPLHTRQLSLYYPGLSTEDFTKMHQLTLGTYQIMVKLQNNDVYEIATLQFPMEFKTNYNIRTGNNIVFTNKCPLPVKYRGNQPEAGINFEGFNYDFNFYLG